MSADTATDSDRTPPRAQSGRTLSAPSETIVPPAASSSPSYLPHPTPTSSCVSETLGKPLLPPSGCTASEQPQNPYKSLSQARRKSLQHLFGRQTKVSNTIQAQKDEPMKDGGSGDGSDSDSNSGDDIMIIDHPPSFHRLKKNIFLYVTYTDAPSFRKYRANRKSTAKSCPSSRTTSPAGAKFCAHQP
eukprot:UC4_evm3s425